MLRTIDAAPDAFMPARIAGHRRQRRPLRASPSWTAMQRTIDGPLDALMPAGLPARPGRRCSGRSTLLPTRSCRRAFPRGLDGDAADDRRSRTAMQRTIDAALDA